MSHRTPSGRTPPPEPEWDEGEDAVGHTTSVINAHSLFRLLLILLTVWTVFEGVALATGAFSAVDAGSLTAQWLGAGNPADTMYQLQVSTAANFTGTLTSTVAASLSATVSSLSPNTTYYARVQSLNRRNVGSAFTTLGSTVTLASVPACSGNTH